MKNFQNTGYYGHPAGAIIHRKTDITAKELLEIRQVKETRQAIITVVLVFAAITLFAILAEVGNSYV